MRGRIRFNDLRELLDEDLGERADESILGLCTRRDLRLAMLQYPLRTGPTEELVWYVAETDALRHIRGEASSVVREQFIAETRHWAMRDLRGGRATRLDGKSEKAADHRPANLQGVFHRFNEATIESWSSEVWEEFTLRALWAVCGAGVAGQPSFAAPQAAPLRHRDLLLAATGEDADLLVHDLLIRFCAAFLDQGFASWQLPRRDEGFFRAFAALHRLSLRPPEGWRRELRRELARLEDGHVRPLESILESLDLLGVAEEEWDDYLAATLLALRGWAGMIRQIELRGDRVVHPVPAGSLIEFLAIRLVLDRLALAYTAWRTLDFREPLHLLRDLLRKRLGPPRTASAEQRAFLIFQLAQVLGWTPERLHHLKEGEWAELLQEVEAFSSVERRRLFHLAYERRFYTQALDAVARHTANESSPSRPPGFQAVFCIDEREGSLRRHLEELATPLTLPSPPGGGRGQGEGGVETFSAAGFFFIPMYYRGATDAHFTALCPAAIQPRHWVVEEVVDHLEEEHQRRARARRLLGTLSHWFHTRSRSFALGALITASVGVFATAPLVARTLLPRLTARIRKRFSRVVQAPRLTRLCLERSADATTGEGEVGFTLEEMSAIGERALRDIGLTSGFSWLVLVLGHGSSSLNNPHESAHDCGACGGARGGPNARALAQILNDPRVRARLERRGLVIPAETVFVGGMHNTSSDTVTFYDTDLVPASHRDLFESVRTIVEVACEQDAHERSRRFDSAPLELSFAAARQHVEGRAEDLAQVRPEWGHATNALSIVGRRAWTRGLFFDRRAFLTSYDPNQDDADHTILTRILQAVFPVCAGINLEYYFSSVDNPGWGCGTKLPHNITGLLGVMDGAGSDLRTGLPWQMVEIHEPVRLLNIIETTPEAMLRILERNEGIARLCRNEWVHLAVLHPQTRRLSIYRKGRFHDYQPRALSLPRTATSVDWYRGWRDPLEFAEIES